MKHLIQAVTFASAIVAGPAFAASWTLVPESSHLAYGSIKKDTVGEVNSFTSLSGQVSPDGQVEVEIDLSSVETNIDIRNERIEGHAQGIFDEQLERRQALCPPGDDILLLQFVQQVRP